MIADQLASRLVDVGDQDALVAVARGSIEISASLVGEISPAAGPAGSS